MGNIKISQLPEADLPLSGSEEFALTQGTTTKKATLAAMVGSAAGTDLVEYYVTPLGDDANDGLTPAGALLTARKLEDLLPPTVRHPTIVHMASGTYAPPQLADRIWKAPIRFVGDGAGVLNDDGKVASLTDTVNTAATDHTIQGLTGGYVADDLVGLSIEFTTGANVGQPRTIRSNTADTITTAWNFFSTPQVGDAFRVFQSAVNFGGTEDGNVFFLDRCGDSGRTASTSNYGSLAMAIFDNVNFSAASTLVSPTLSDSCLLFWGCRITGTMQPTNSRVISGTFFTATRGMLQLIEQVGVTEAEADNREGWCLSDGAVFAMPRAHMFEGFYVTRATGTVFGQPGSSLVLKGGRASNLTISGAGASISLSNGGATAATQPQFLFDRRSSSGPSLALTDGAVGTISMGLEFADSVNTTVAIQAIDRAIIYALTVTGSGLILIAGTTVADLEADIGGMIKYQSENDFQFGDATTLRVSGTDSTMASIASEGQLFVDGSVIYQRATA